MNQLTSFPGLLVPEETAEKILSDLKQHYRINTEDRPPHIPTWCVFPEGKSVEFSILETPIFLSKMAVYLYNENSNKLYLSTPQAVKNYFQQRNPWETDWDLYIFEQNLKWCIAITHELLNGSEAILAGELVG